MSMLTCTANILSELADEDRPRALYQGLRHVANECAGRPPRFLVDPLPTGERRSEVFKGWFRGFIEVRDDEGAERCLHTAIDMGVPPREIADIVFAGPPTASTWILDTSLTSATRPLSCLRTIPPQLSTPSKRRSGPAQYLSSWARRWPTQPF